MPVPNLHGCPPSSIRSGTERKILRPSRSSPRRACGSRRARSPARAASRGAGRVLFTRDTHEFSTLRKKKKKKVNHVSLRHLMLILALNYLAAQLLMEYAQMADEFKARLTIQRANRIFVNVHENVTDRCLNLAPQGSAAWLTLCARRCVSDTAARCLPHWRYGHHNRLGVRNWPGVCDHRVHCGANRVAGVLQGRAEAS